MTRALPTLMLLCATLWLPLAWQAPLAQTVVEPATARVIVRYREDARATPQQQVLAVGAGPAGRAHALGQRLGITLRTGRALTPRSEVLFASGMSSAALAHRLAALADVDYAVPDQRRRAFAAPNDPLYLTAPAPYGPATGQWYLRPPTASVLATIDVEPAWTATLADPAIVVAVLDTGVRFDHPDLLPVGSGGNLLTGYDLVTDVGIANDGGGRDADATDPGDWVTDAEANDPNGQFYQCTTKDPLTGRYVAEDSSWHGTQVSGLIAASTGNGAGIASVGRSVRVLPVRVLGKCGGYDSDIIAGMRWAAGVSVPGLPTNVTPARVLNLSLGGEGVCNAAYREAIAEMTGLNIVVVASAGNTAGHAVNTPANCPGVIGVAGLRHVGSKVGFSDLGPQIALGAPAGNCVNTASNLPCLYPILTTSNAGTSTPVAGAGGAIYTNAYNASLGTSFSAPLVSGTVALMLATQPALVPGEVRAVLQLATRNYPTSGASNEGSAAPVTQCTAPQIDGSGKPVDQLQCYCTTSTCGAGMTDAGAAVLAAAAGQRAQITISPATAVVGQPLDLAYLATGRADSALQWIVTGGAGTLAGATTGATGATLVPTTAGTLSFGLRLTDAGGKTTITTRTIEVQAASGSDAGGSNSSGGGGGALGIGWLAALAAAVVALRLAPQRRA